MHHAGRKHKTEIEIKLALAQNIKRLRRIQRNFLSAETVANELGISRVAYTQIENGRSNVTAVTLWKLACKFECEIADFFPAIPQGFGLSQNDLDEIVKKDELNKAVGWAEVLFGPIKK